MAEKKKVLSMADEDRAFFEYMRKNNPNAKKAINKELSSKRGKVSVPKKAK